MKTLCFTASLWLILFTNSHGLFAAEAYILGGYQGGGHFTGARDETFSFADDNSLSLIVDFEWDNDQELEFIYSHQSTTLLDNSVNPNTTLFDIDIDYLQLGSRTLLEEKNGWRSYVVGSVGLVHLSPSENFNATTRFSAALGFSLKKNISKRIVLRADAIAFGILLDQGSAIFCSNSNCSIFIEGDVETQYQISLGIGFQFY